MIGYLQGEVISNVDDSWTILCSGVGYEVHVSHNVPLYNPPACLWIHEHAPQDAPHELYGFQNRLERDLFRRLLDVKGVGPKVAMRIVAARGINESGVPVPTTLASVRGVGTKIIAAIMEHFSA